MVAFWGFTLKNILGAAIRTGNFTGFQDIKVDTRMLTPQRSAGLRTVQRQVVGSDFNNFLFSHSVISLVLVRR